MQLMSTSREDREGIEKLIRELRDEFTDDVETLGSYAMRGDTVTYPIRAHYFNGADDSLEFDVLLDKRTGAVIYMPTDE